eukprot:1530600-Pleurochrysis_carterae.AAC.1
MHDLWQAVSQAGDHVVAPLEGNGVCTSWSGQRGLCAAASLAVGDGHYAGESAPAGAVALLCWVLFGGHCTQVGMELAGHWAWNKGCSALFCV